ncbi:MAG: glucose-6-phosphate isomerase [bacterium]|nr:glucose-6-phosphate isomerase [bacterium]
MAEKMLRYDFTNVRAEAVGAAGLGAEDWAAAESYLGRVYAQAQAARSSWGFTKLPYRDGEADALIALANELASQCDNFVVIGIGGSALGAIALHSSCNPPFYNLMPRESRGNRPRLFIPDNIDPVLISNLLATLDPARTIVNVVAKSGSTAETMANFLVVQAWLQRAVGSAWTKHVVITTDPEKGALRALARERGLRALEIPPDVGGRFSVLTPVGLLPAAVEGIEIKALLRGARDMLERCGGSEWRHDPAFMNAAIHYLYDVRKQIRIHVMMPYAQGLRDVADWFRQLWAESLGKRVNRRGEVVQCGPTPVNALGATDQHSQVQLYVEGPVDKLFTFIHVDQFSVQTSIPAGFSDDPAFSYLSGQSLNKLLHAEEFATRAALTKAGRPHVAIALPAINPYYVGQLLMFLELQTAYAGELYDINAFDQPGVEQGKIFTYALMGRAGYDAARAELKGMELSRPDCII